MTENFMNAATKAREQYASEKARPTAGRPNTFHITEQNVQPPI